MAAMAIGTRSEGGRASGTPSRLPEKERAVAPPLAKTRASWRGLMTKHDIIRLVTRPVIQREATPMPTIEERLQTLEQEHTALKKTIELQTIAIGALVTKAELEKLSEKYDKLFETLIAHDRSTNEQLAELRNQHTELDGKVVGLQTEMRQRFVEQDHKFTDLQNRQVEHTTRLDRLETLLTKILDRLPER
jgi:hypothetical protein